MSRTRLLVFDLDGTLLDSSHRIPADVRSMLLDLRKSGIETTKVNAYPTLTPISGKTQCTD